MYKIIMLLTIITLLCDACAPSEESIAEAVQKTISAFTPVPTQTNLPTYTIVPSQTALPTYTPYPTQTPFIVTPTYTSTPEFTPTNTATSTPIPGIGASVNCGDYFTVKVLEPPIFQEYVHHYISEKATGIFLIIKIELTNLTSETWDDFYVDEFLVTGSVDGRELTFESTFTPSSLMADKLGYQEFAHDEPQPGVPYLTAAVFDVHPDGEDWVFIFKPDMTSSNDTACEVKIPLYEQ